MAELNKIIDKRLPGWPRFEQHEIIVSDEVCEVYFHDIIACIRALFGDPSFVLYLVFGPEKHYTDDKKNHPAISRHAYRKVVVVNAGENSTSS